MIQLLLVLRIIIFVAGASLVLTTFLSAIRTFVLPRSAPDFITQTVFLLVRYILEIRKRHLYTFAARDRAMELYSPISLLLLLITWLICIQIGYMAMDWAVNAVSWYDSFKLSGSSLLTLGFSLANNLPTMILTFSEATMGLILIALLISYLPTIYSSFERREAAVTMLEVRAGSPPSAIQMIIRYSRLNRLEYLEEIWIAWEGWFVDIEESHSSLPALLFLRSPQPQRSWVTAAGAVLDGASITLAAVDVPRDSQADLCIRAGYLSLRYIADFFRLQYDANPAPTDPISVTQAEFNEALETMALAGVPLKPDREQSWIDFKGWRVNYDTVLLGLAELTMAPNAPWSSDRHLDKAPRIRRWRRNKRVKQEHQWIPPSGL
jgi:hypothetical protein